MAKKQHKYRVEGTHFTRGKGFHKADLEIHLPQKPAKPGPVKGVGTPISQDAFKEMQSRYFAWKKKTDTEYITFGRESILRILSQHGCAGIKFYFVERPNSKTHQLTLSMAGVDEKNKELSVPSTGLTATQGISQSLMMDEFGTGHPPGGG